MNERIYILISKKINNEATEQEILELDSLLSKEDELQHQIYAIEEFWKSPVSSVESDNALLESKWDNLQGRLKKHKFESKTIFFGRSAKAKLLIADLISIAASVILFLVITPLIYKDNKIGLTTISAPKGAITNVVLPDGSKVTINSGSSIVYKNSFDRNHRELELSGEAFFDIVKDPNHPFVILTSIMKVRVLGTTFNLRSYPGETSSDASLLTGIIELTVLSDPSKKKIVLKPSEKLTILSPPILTVKKETKTTVSLPEIKMGNIHRSIEDQVPSELMWMENRIFFDGMEFGEIARMMERKYNATFTFRDSIIRKTKFTGRFDNIPVDRALRQLKLLADFDYKINGSHIIINRLPM